LVVNAGLARLAMRQMWLNRSARFIRQPEQALRHASTSRDASEEQNSNQNQIFVSVAKLGGRTPDQVYLSPIAVHSGKPLSYSPQTVPTKPSQL
jgi:hypothetical protein